MKHIYRYAYSRLLKPLGLVMGFFIGHGVAIAQNYNFSHYGIEDGLIQSQVTNFCEDNSHRLWVATLGGSCRFDGKDYNKVSKEKGLINNFVYCIHADGAGKIWFGTIEGLSCLENGKIYNFKYPINIKRPYVSNICEDAEGRIWVTMNNHLFRVTGHQMQAVKISSDDKEVISCIAVNRVGKLFVSVFQKGIYTSHYNKWQNILSDSLHFKPVFIQKMVFDQKDISIIYLLTSQDIYISDGKNLSIYEKKRLERISRPFLSMEKDGDNNLWIGTKNGAFKFNERKLIHFTAENGFSNFPVFAIYNDLANNLWLGTGGNGFYKYEGDDYRTYSHSNVNKNIQVIVGIGQDKKHEVLVGTDNNGLMKFDNNELTPFWLPANNFAKSILSLYTDKEKNLWIGTYFGGIWEYDGNRFLLIKGTEKKAINAIASEDDGTLWFGTPDGCYYLNNGIINRLNDFNYFVSSLLVIGKDSVVIGTQHGAFLSVDKKIVAGFNIKALDASSIYCILRDKNNLLFGTDDKGLFVYNNKTGNIKNYNTKDGLKSSSIYSMVLDKKGIIWLGTGLGVDRMLSQPNLNYKVLPNIYSKNEVAETNQNSAFSIEDKVLFGSTKGLTIYNTEIQTVPSDPPYIIINDVHILNQAGKDVKINNRSSNNTWVYNYDQNHLVISFLGVDLKNPDGVSYEYKLSEVDSQFCSPVKNNTVDYPALLHGKYIFEVKAINAAGVVSKQTSKYSFEILQPYYQTIVFRVALLLLFLLLLFLSQAFFRRQAMRRKLAIEVIKKQEKAKLREQTAEDFHDDLGNKLTRITILSDILHTKLDKSEVDQIKIVDQIKQNANSLFHGTKEILWALDPQSDNLYEILNHIKYFGHELFLEMPVNFQFKPLNKDLKAIKLPMEYSRNIPMIFKELLNNVLKHSDAKNAVISLKFTGRNEINIQLVDDGKGFNTETAKGGHGLNNINARTKRINGQFSINSKKGEGTIAILKLKL